MARTVVGLFDKQQDAMAAMDALSSAGFGTDRATLVSRATSRLAEMLGSAGVPQEDARLYNDGVKQGGAMIVAQGLPDAEAEQVANILDGYNVVDISQRGQLSQQTMETRQTMQTSTKASARNANAYQGGDMVIPIIEEEIQVGKREVESGGVRVSTSVEEMPVNEQVTLREETVTVERRQVDQRVDPSEIDSMVQEGSIEVREHDEQAQVTKEARVVEEVVINKDTQERTETIQDSVRRTDVDVEQIQGETHTSATETVGRVAGWGKTGQDKTTGDEGAFERGASKLGNTVEGATGADLDQDGDVGRRDPRNNH